MYRLLEKGVLRLADNKEIKPDRSDADWLDYQELVKAGYVPEPMTLATIVETLDERKARRINLIRSEGLTRIQAFFPVASFDDLALLRAFWASLTGAAKSPTPQFQKVLDIGQAGQTAIAQVKAATSKAAVDAVVVSWPA